MSQPTTRSNGEDESRLRDRLVQLDVAHLDRSLFNVRSLAGSGLGLSADQWIDLAAQTPDLDLALNGLERFVSAEPGTIDSTVLPRLALLAGTSDQLIDSAVGLASELVPRASPEPLPLPFSGTSEEELQHWHRLQSLQICLAELEGRLRVEQTASSLSRLADETMLAAIRSVGGKPEDLSVIALGKWGGNELNYSSDIDLYFIRGDRCDESHATRIAREVLALLAGRGRRHLYRTDLRLRPGGPSGPLVPTLRQADRELRVHAGTWDRMVHIRARAVCGPLLASRTFATDLQEFVYEGDFRAEDIHQLQGYKNQLERTLEGRDPERRQIKVGWGGIRDVEYIVQFLQLLHGAIYPSIRAGNVFRAIPMLHRVGALTLAESSFLAEGYRFLRTIEHRLMLRHRLQSFVLPEDPPSRRALARGLGYSDWNDFRAQFDLKRNRIRAILDRLFHRLFSGGSIDEINLVLAFKPEPTEIDRTLGSLGFRDPGKAYLLLRRLAYPRRRELRSPRARQFLAHLLPNLLARLRAVPDSDQALLMFTNCVETLGTPATFYQLLADQPEYCALFVDLFGCSRFISELLLNHPGNLDEVIDRLRIGEPVQEETLVDELRSTLAGSNPDRRIKRLHEFRAVHLVETAILDLAARIPLLGVIDRLSSLARATLRIVDDVAEAELVERLGVLKPTSDRPPEHVILALGRLGGQEMGYASDIDMILVYDGEGVTESGHTEREFFTQLLQRVVGLLNNPGHGGALYSTDLRLRPRGQGGSLVHSFREFRSYFTSEESQIWEHQALVRSAPVAGSLALGDRVLGFVRSNVGRGLDVDRILSEMISMHVRRKGVTHGGFHLKAGPGGLLDIEFLVQCAILLGAHEERALWQPNTYRAIHELTERGFFVPQEGATLSTAYTFFRLVENRLSMMHRSSVRMIPTDHESLEDLARRIGYQAPESGKASDYLLEEIRYHTRRVREVFEQTLERLRSDLSGSTASPGGAPDESR
ncbi:MAG: hypothetical protein KDC38_08965 [Planctomycetes bacterium]|nr:hypothetical protein [Planctomycetota bacterium]